MNRQRQIDFLPGPVLTVLMPAFLNRCQQCLRRWGVNGVVFDVAFRTQTGISKLAFDTGGRDVHTQGPVAIGRNKPGAAAMTAGQMLILYIDHASFLFQLLEDIADRGN